jgi:hypothetical protein
MLEASQPSTANIAVACAIVGGVTGYMLGQAKSLGLFGSSPAPSDPKEKDSDASEEENEEDSEEEHEEDIVPAEFPNHDEECKMVLVVRTDLGMTKGTTTFLTLHGSTDASCRQNRRTMRARDTGLLQAFLANRPDLEDTAAVGDYGAGKGRAAGQERRRAGDAAGTGAESGPRRARHT